MVSVARALRSPHDVPADETVPARSRGSNVVWADGALTRGERWQHLGCKGGTLWLTGLSASGKSTVASRLEQVLVERGRFAYRLDGDNLRHGLNGDLGFASHDRMENIRRSGEVAKLFADSGGLAIAGFISPYREDRDRCRAMHEQAGLIFLEVYVEASLEECERRDPKGLYSRARAGEIKNFTGLTAPYEAPEDPDLVLHTGAEDVDACVTRCLTLLEQHGLV